MQKLHYSIVIDAPRQKVWDTMLQDETYRRWTTAFNPQGSWYEGDWNTGSTLRFLGPGKDGKLSGMISRVKENRPLEFVSLEHVGIIQDGQEDTTSAEVKKWVPAFENYSFSDNGGGTEVRVDVDVADEHKRMFEEMWPQALQSLKALAEN